MWPRDVMASDNLIDIGSGKAWSPVNVRHQANTLINASLTSLTDSESTYCGLATPYGDIDLGQHWLR